MDVSTIANLVNAFAVTAGVIFAAAQIRYYRQRRQRDAMLELVHHSKAQLSPVRFGACCLCRTERTRKKYAKCSDLTGKMPSIWFR